MSKMCLLILDDATEQRQGSADTEETLPLESDSEATGNKCVHFVI